MSPVPEETRKALWRHVLGTSGGGLDRAQASSCRITSDISPIRPLLPWRRASASLRGGISRTSVAAFWSADFSGTSQRLRDSKRWIGPSRRPKSAFSSAESALIPTLRPGFRETVGLPIWDAVLPLAPRRPACRGRRPARCPRRLVAGAHRIGAGAWRRTGRLLRWFRGFQESSGSGAPTVILPSSAGRAAVVGSCLPGPATVRVGPFVSYDSSTLRKAPGGAFSYAGDLALQPRSVHMEDRSGSHRSIRAGDVRPVQPNLSEGAGGHVGMTVKFPLSLQRRVALVPAKARRGRRESRRAGSRAPFCVAVQAKACRPPGRLQAHPLPKPGGVIPGTGLEVGGRP